MTTRKEHTLTIAAVLFLLFTTLLDTRITVMLSFILVLAAVYWFVYNRQPT